MVRSRTLNILAIDPAGEGGDTGIVAVTLPPDKPAYITTSWAVHDGFDGFIEQWVPAYFGNMTTANVVIVEHFVNYLGKAADITPVLIEGVVRYLAQGTEIVLQPSSGKNTAVPDSALARLGWDTFDSRDHHHDRKEAARHALWWIKKQRHLPTLAVAWPRTA